MDEAGFFGTFAPIWVKTFGLCWALERSKGCAGWPGGGGRWFRSGLEKRECLSNV